MADKEQGKKNTILKRGVSEYEWRASANGPPLPAGPGRLDWNVPAGLEPGAMPHVGRRRRSRWYWPVRIGVVVLLTAAVLALIAEASLRGFDAQGVSMEPAIHDGDRIIINKLAYDQIDFGLLDWAPFIDVHGHWATPSRGDVIVFRSPVEDKELIKRVIGLPGEEVTIANDRVYINGTELDEPYAQGETRCKITCNWHLGAGEYFVLGDNRENSLDSREGWLVSRDAIDGEKIFSY